MNQEDQPELKIAYSPQFSLHLRLVESARVVDGGYTGWRYVLRCFVRHSTGQFTYEADDLYFHLAALEGFYEQLGAIREGRGQSAELLDESQMILFRLYLEERHLRAAIRIREYQPENELTTLTAGFAVDYDLFANKLHLEMNEFIRALRRVTPEQLHTK